MAFLKQYRTPEFFALAQPLIDTDTFTSWNDFHKMEGMQKYNGDELVERSSIDIIKEAIMNPRGSM